MQDMCMGAALCEGLAGLCLESQPILPAKALSSLAIMEKTDRQMDRQTHRGQGRERERERVTSRKKVPSLCASHPGQVIS